MDKREQQDKLWSLLSREDKLHYKDTYNCPMSSSSNLLEDIFGAHNLNPNPTYEDIVEALIRQGKYLPLAITDKTDLHGKKLVAINKLLNVAKYLNGDWKPDWKNDKELKFYIYLDSEKVDNLIYITYTKTENYGLVSFREREFAEQAVDILGEETIALAFSNDY